jgi:hypothetical protein
MDNNNTAAGEQRLVLIAAVFERFIVRVVVFRGIVGSLFAFVALLASAPL